MVQTAVRRRQPSKKTEYDGPADGHHQQHDEREQDQVVDNRDSLPREHVAVKIGSTRSAGILRNLDHLTITDAVGRVDLQDQTPQQNITTSGSHTQARAVVLLDLSALLYALAVVRSWYRSHETVDHLLLHVDVIASLDILKKAPRSLGVQAREAIRWLDRHLEQPVLPAHRTCKDPEEQEEEEKGNAANAGVQKTTTSRIRLLDEAAAPTWREVLALANKFAPATSQPQAAESLLTIPHGSRCTLQALLGCWNPAGCTALSNSDGTTMTSPPRLRVAVMDTPNEVLELNLKPGVLRRLLLPSNPEYRVNDGRHSTSMGKWTATLRHVFEAYIGAIPNAPDLYEISAHEVDEAKLQDELWRSSKQSRRTRRQSSEGSSRASNASPSSSSLSPNNDPKSDWRRFPPTSSSMHSAPVTNTGSLRAQRPSRSRDARPADLAIANDATWTTPISHDEEHSNATPSGTLHPAVDAVHEFRQSRFPVQLSQPAPEHAQVGTANADRRHHPTFTNNVARHHQYIHHGHYHAQHQPQQQQQQHRHGQHQSQSQLQSLQFQTQKPTLHHESQYDVSHSPHTISHSAPQRGIKGIPAPGDRALRPSRQRKLKRTPSEERFLRGHGTDP